MVDDSDTAVLRALRNYLRPGLNDTNREGKSCANLQDVQASLKASVDTASKHGEDLRGDYTFHLLFCASLEHQYI